MARTIEIGVGMAFGIAFVVQCGGTEANHHSPGIARMEDGGLPSDGSLADGSPHGVLDGMIGVGDADASPTPNPVLNGTCDKTSTLSYTSGSNTVTQITYWSEFAVNGLTIASSPSVSVTQCNYKKWPGFVAMDLNEIYQPQCAGQPSCSVTGYSVPGGTCNTWDGGRIVDGKIVINCGTHYLTTVTAGGAVVSDSGYVSTSVLVRLN